jgi:hypothetical protein
MLAKIKKAFLRQHRGTEEHGTIPSCDWSPHVVPDLGINVETAVHSNTGNSPRSLSGVKIPSWTNISPLIALVGVTLGMAAVLFWVYRR